MKTRQNLLLLSLVLGMFLTPLVGHAATLTRTSSFEYDPASGLITKEIIEPDNSALCLVTEYAYDAFGNKTSGTTRNCTAPAATGDAVFTARTSNNTYDARGQFAITSKNALGQSESKTYEAKSGALTKLTGPNALSTTWQYDGFDRRTLETRADGTRTRWEYLYCSGFNGGTTACPTIAGAAGKWLIKETPLASDGVTQNGPVSKRYFDMLDREIRIETQGFDGSGTATAIYKDTQYDSLGRPYKSSLPYYAGQTAYWSTATYDALGRVIQVTQPDGGIVSTSYGGHTITVTDPLGRKTSTTVDSQGQVTKVVDPQSKVLTYSYDPFGNLHTTTDALGNVVRLSYDLRGRKTYMQDPDMGNWTYVYNGLGELVKQTDAKGQVSTMLYDRLGRMTRRTEPDLISNWYYDAYKSGAACQKGIGKLCQAETSTGYNRTANYDTLGRSTSSATTIDVPTPYAAAVSYDTHGRVATQTYPNGLVVKYVYTALGYLKEVRNNASNALYWRADTRDAEGHLRQQTYGNNIVTQQTWSATTGFLTGIVAGAGNAVQNLGYTYDKVGNLITRTDVTQGLSESFVYDSLNRLTNSTVNSSGAGIVTKSYAYDAIGNITSKNDLGTYTYPTSGGSSVRPHAVSQVTLSVGGKIAFAYDANGSLTTQTQTNAANQIVTAKGRSQFYTSFNMPQSMSQGTISAAFYYGPEHQRVKQISSVQGTTIYVNPGNEGALFFEKDIKPNGSVEQRAFISAGGQAVAIVKTTISGSTTTTVTRYLHRDHLGSVSAITNESGAVLERLSFEPFGKRRFANGANDPNNTIAPLNTDRGFTDHEMLDEIGLIHMNGRVYDPLVGRFLSADPFIQSPDNLQSYNRYSYVMNNPLVYTDPSGYFSWKKLINSYTKYVIAPTPKNTFDAFSNMPGQSIIDNFVMQNSWAYSVGMVAATISTSWVCGGCGGAVFASYYAYQSTGSMTKAYKAGAIAYAMSYTMGVLGEIGGYGAQMLGGGINGYVQTGTSKGFWRGFAAGAIPNNLGVDAYYGSGFAAGFANLAIGVVRDGIRGAIVADSSKGFAKGALYGQANNIVGHIVGMVSTGALPKFENGAFIYEGEFWKELGAITFGNVISGSQSFLEGQMPRGNYTVLQHERGHIPQSTALGVAYIPAHAISLSVSWLFGERDARGKRNTHGNINLLENSLHQYPDNGSAPGSSLDWFYGTRYK